MIRSFVRSLHAEFRNKLILFGRSIAKRFDGALLRFWEIARYLTIRLPSSGELSAILRRMGTGGFTEYWLGQKSGYFGQRSFLPTERQVVAERLRTDFPDLVDGIIANAEILSKGIFDFLGSGPVDMRRGNKGGGHRIDWRRDITTGNCFPRIFCQWHPLGQITKGLDIDLKGPWELTRCQHFPTLGQAYWLTGDERYARCYAGTVQDFLRHNPVGFGIHWVCPMDVGLRVVGWLTGLSFFQGSAALSDRWWRKFLKGLVAHGRFLAANLEIGNINRRLITANHYVADLLGLYWIGVCFPHIDAGMTWRAIAERGFEREIRIQIHDDGGDFEAGVPYQRLVVEMFLSAYALSLHFGEPFSDGYRDRLLSALRFVKTLRQPGGRIPQIGDADSGRGHILTGFGKWSQESMDHLLVAGATVLNCPELAEGLPRESLIEQIFWGDARTEPMKLPYQPNPLVFPDFGVAVLRRGPSYIAFSNGRVGTEGFGNHTHNDQLAVEWVVDDQPLLVDGGSYIYTRDPDARNHFRSVASHNTVMVDGEEQNTFDPIALFRMEQAGQCWFSAPVSSGEWIGVSGTHTAYERLKIPVTHRRRVVVRSDGVVVIDDHLEGGAGHDLRWHFLLYPGTTAESHGSSVVLKGSKPYGKIESCSEITWSTIDGWYSSGYGVRDKTSALVAQYSGSAERFVHMLVPDRAAAPEINDLTRLIDGIFEEQDETVSACS